jgi:DNA excision repair protein ERCC-4
MEWLLSFHKAKIWCLFELPTSFAWAENAGLQFKNITFSTYTRHVYLISFQSGRCIGPILASEPEPILSQNSLTRNAGGRKPTEREMQVTTVILILSRF